MIGEDGKTVVVKQKIYRRIGRVHIIRGGKIKRKESIIHVRENYMIDEEEGGLRQFHIN